MAKRVTIRSKRHMYAVLGFYDEVIKFSTTSVVERRLLLKMAAKDPSIRWQDDMDVEGRTYAWIAEEA